MKSNSVIHMAITSAKIDIQSGLCGQLNNRHGTPIHQKGGVTLPYLFGIGLKLRVSKKASGPLETLLLALINFASNMDR